MELERIQAEEPQVPDNPNTDNTHIQSHQSPKLKGVPSRLKFKGVLLIENNNLRIREEARD